MKKPLALNAPYLLFIGDTDNPTYAKTALGIVQWRPQLVAGQWRFPGNRLDLGVPEMSIEHAIKAGVKSVVIGIAPVGGEMDTHSQEQLAKAAEAGLDIVSGLHTQLETIHCIAAAAAKSNASLINVRTPPASIGIGNGHKRTGRRVLMVGTDCSVGKKYTALALTECLKSLGLKATFRATGQTGIMIAGQGIAIDAVVADFIAGAAEQISPDNAADHWDVIEGQGSLFNPSYAGVSLGLLHGSQPDALVICHDAMRTMIDSCPHIPVPSVQQCIDLNLRCARLTNSNVRCVGVSVNTSALTDDQRLIYLQDLSAQIGLPCIDPLITGCDILAQVLADFDAKI